ncbi:prepilin-type N-terminal cleavage/methylation domain-containing protein [Clostridium tagluense]|uniref:prepilin-type N-terminal cleavage/methylation domain-containing protein n=1 Tax=Clostridium tagluense TaxID=360422 RepID=UPI0025B78A6E|nr:prepilin-type N-terminal cleavage/methylation domain-containing protein [Clostridium tagluense]
MKKNLKKKKGFTLIELIIVISIIAVLAAIAVPKYASIQKDAKVKADIATAKTIADAVIVLVAQDKVSETIGTSDAPAEIKAGATGDAAVIGDYLQLIPTSAVYKDKNFSVVVSNGIAKVYVDNIEVYPNAKDYGAKVTTDKKQN